MAKGLRKASVMMTIIGMMLVYFATPAKGAMLYEASLTLSNPAASGNGNHAFTMKVKSGGTVKGIKLQYLKQPSGSTQNPTDLSVASSANATLPATSELTGNWAIDDTTAVGTDIVYLTKEAGDALVEGNDLDFTLDNVTNPPIADGNTGCTTPTGDGNDTTGTCYVKISTWDTNEVATMADEGTNWDDHVIDYTTVSFTVTTQVTMKATVDASMQFIVEGITSGTATLADAGTAAAASGTSYYNEIDYGNLTVGSPEVMGHKLYVKTNAQNGYSVKVRSTTDDASGSVDADGIFKGQYTTNNIDGFSAGNFTTPAAWTAPTNEVANVNSGFFGINSNDTNTVFNGAAAGHFAAMENDTWNTVMTKGGPDLGNPADAHIITYAIEVNVYQPADQYTGYFQYQATPKY